jgi:copper(I)-binding protein
MVNLPHADKSGYNLEITPLGLTMKMKFLIILRPMALIIFAGMLLGCAPNITDDEPYLDITDGWARTEATAAGASTNEAQDWKTPVGPLGLGPNGLVFMTIDNKGGAPDKLLKASTDVANSVVLHQMVESGQQTYTRPVTAIDLPARTATELKSGSYYIRLVDLKRRLANKSKFDLILEFEKSGKRTVEIVIGNP